MFCKIILASVSVLLVAVLSADANSDSSLNRVLNQYQEKDVKTEQRRIPVEIKASLIPRPEGYKNPKNWTRDSALRLMHLLRGNKKAAPLQQTLKNILASSIAAGSSGVKLRRTEELSVLKIDNHLQLNLPSARVDLKTLIDLLLPKRTLSWLSSFGSSNTPPGKGWGEVGNGGYGSGIKESSRYGIGGSRGHSGYGIGGPGEHGSYGIGGSGGHSHYGTGGSGDNSHYGIGGSGGHSHYGIGGSGEHSHYGIGGSGEHSHYGIGGSGESGGYGIGGSSSTSDEGSSSYGIGGWEDEGAILDWISEHFGTPNNSSSNQSVLFFGTPSSNYGSPGKKSGPGRQ